MKEIIRNSEIFIYVLELENGKFYVGQSFKVQQRFKEHMQGEGANFTKKHRCLSLLKTYRTNTNSYITALLFENYITLLLMRIHGWQNVKGGKLLNLNQHKINGMSLETRILRAKNLIREHRAAMQLV